MPIYNELRNGSKQKMMKVATVAVLAVFIVFTIVSFFGYFTWYDLTMGEVLLMYSSINPTDIKILLARSCILICVILSAPLLHFTCRRAQIKLFYGDNKKFSWATHIGFMIINLTIVGIVAITFHGKINAFFGFGGAITANSLVIILPCGMYWNRAVAAKSFFFMVVFVTSRNFRKPFQTGSDGSALEVDQKF